MEEGVIREVKEEAGVDVRLTGILRIEYMPCVSRYRVIDEDGGDGEVREEHYVRLRIIFLAEPIDVSQPPKNIPDYESVGACWVSPEEFSSIPLRGSEPVECWEQCRTQNPPIAPLEVLQSFPLRRK